LRVVDDKVSAFDELDMPLVAWMVEFSSGTIPKGLMVRDVCHYRTIRGNPVRDRWRCMVQVLRFNKDFTDPEKAFLELCIVNPACEVLHLDREVRVLHLTRKRIFETPLERNRAVNVQLASGQKCGREKRKSLNMIPMRVADQQMNSMRTQALEHVETKQAYSGTAVENDSCAIVGADFDAGGIASIDSCLVSWRRDGTTGSPETYVHCRAIFAAMHVAVKRIRRKERRVGHGRKISPLS
jgi:hypothetical protein